MRVDGQIPDIRRRKGVGRAGYFTAKVHIRIKDMAKRRSGDCARKA